MPEKDWQTEKAKVQSPDWGVIGFIGMRRMGKLEHSVYLYKFVLKKKDTIFKYLNANS